MSDAPFLRISRLNLPTCCISLITRLVSSASLFSARIPTDFFLGEMSPSPLHTPSSSAALDDDARACVCSCTRTSLSFLIPDNTCRVLILSIQVHGNDLASWYADFSAAIQHHKRRAVRFSNSAGRLLSRYLLSLPSLATFLIPRPFDSLMPYTFLTGLTRSPSLEKEKRRDPDSRAHKILFLRSPTIRSRQDGGVNCP